VNLNTHLTLLSARRALRSCDLAPTQSKRSAPSDKLGDLLVATEPIRIGLCHRFETDEQTLERDRPFAGRSAQHRAQKFRELLGLVELVADPLVLPRKVWQCRSPGHSLARIGMKAKSEAPVARESPSRTSLSTQFTTPLAPTWTAKGVASLELT
jgi:hypothetical protein